MAQPTLPPWIKALQERDPEFVLSYMGQRERILRDGAIPAKYKHLMTMLVMRSSRTPTAWRILPTVPAPRVPRKRKSRKRLKWRICSVAPPPWSPP